MTATLGGAASIFVGGSLGEPGSEDYYHLTDPQLSTVAIVDEVKSVRERVEYTAYGEARHHPGADITGDGMVDISDLTQVILHWEETGSVIADITHDGIVNIDDESAIILQWGTQLPGGELSMSSVDNSFGFTGQLFNRETLSSLARYRWYDPRLGRWLSRDPAGYADGMLLYAYVGGNPVLLVDPLGLSVWGNVCDWWSNLSQGADSLVFGESRYYTTEYYEKLSANQGAIQSQLVNEGKMSQAQMDALQSGLAQTTQAVQDAAIDLDQAKVDFAVGVVVAATAPISAPVAAVGAGVSTVTELGNAAVDVSQGQTTEALFRVGGAAAGPLISKGLGKVLSGATEEISEGSHVVYQGVDKAGVVRYVGITERRVATRAAEHVASGQGKENLIYSAIQGAENLTKQNARIWEQSLINQYGLGKNGGQLLNNINSISPKFWEDLGIAP